MRCHASAHPQHALLLAVKETVTLLSCMQTANLYVLAKQEMTRVTQLSRCSNV